MSFDDAISKLPSEVLFQIFLQLIGSEKDLCNLCLVSKLWNLISSDNGNTSFIVDVDRSVIWKIQYKEKYGTTDIIVIFNGSDLYSHSQLDFSWKFIFSRRFKIERKVLKKLSENPPEAPPIEGEDQSNVAAVPLHSAGDLFKFGKKIEKYGRIQHDYVKRLNYLQVATEVYASAVGIFVKPHSHDDPRSARSMFYLSLFYSRWSSVYSQLAEKLLRKAQRRKLGHLKQNENAMKEDITLSEVDLTQLFQTSQYILELAESILEKAKTSVSESDGWYSNLLSAETRVLLNMLECKQAVNVELAECNQVWEKMQTSLQKAVETQPNNGTYADALRARGRMLAQYNPADQEIDQVFQQTIELIRKQLVRCPGDQWLLNDLALVYGTQGKVCLRAGDKEKALQHFKQSIKLLKEYRTTSEDRFESIYNLACFYSLSMKSEKCFEMLKLLHTDSNLYESDLLEDDDFNNVRQCTWFTDLLNQLRSSNKLVRDMKSLNLDWV